MCLTGAVFNRHPLRCPKRQKEGESRIPRKKGSPLNTQIAICLKQGGEREGKERNENQKDG